jgi:pimeloyl-ACP methyl ester carboxylesterase
VNQPFQVTNSQGRRIAYSIIGSQDGYPAIYAHGFPSSAREACLLEHAASKLGVRLIALDRPGYGNSAPAPDREILDWPEDVRCVADALALEHFAVIGVSGGGPYALACAQAAVGPGARPLQDRLSQCTLVCPLGPIYRDEALNQMHWTARANLSVGRYPPIFSDLIFAKPTTGLFARWPSLVDNMRNHGASAADQRVLADAETRSILNQTITDAMRQGAPGARRDLYLYTHDWQIPFQQIEFPITIWHGDADSVVPIEHARWYANQLPQSDLIELADQGHYSVPIAHGHDILAKLRSDRGSVT